MTISNGNDTRAEPKVVLLVRLLNAIDEGRHSFEALKERIAEEKSPSTRSLRRYLAILADAGFPWYFDRATGTYRFSDGYSLKRLNLNSRELVGLVTLKRLGASLGGTLAAYIDEAAGKLLSSADRRGAESADRPPSLAIRLDEVALTPEAEKTFEKLQAAERSRRRLQFSYIDKTGRTSERRVDPYGFIVSNGRVYMVGYDHGRSDMRVFAVDNVTDATALPATFERPADFNLDAFGANSVSGVVNSQTLTAVRVRFSPIVAKAAVAVAIARERRIERHGDGSVEITYTIADPLEIVRWTLGWGGEAEVVEPSHARTTARDLARRIAERHG